MKWIKYETKSRLEAKVAIINSVSETLVGLREDMLDPLAYTVVDDGIDSKPPAVDVLKEKLENLLRIEGAKSTAIDRRLDAIEDCIIEIAQELYK